MTQIINITESAQTYLNDLLSKQDQDGIGVRVFVQQPGTPHAETCLAYCRPGEEQDDDVRLDYTPFPAYVEEQSIPFLEDAIIDFAADKMGGTLTIKAPNSKMPRVGEDASVRERINYVLWTEINPMLSSHGGEVSLVELVDEEIAILKFGGGCQGCSAVDMTLKEGVEKTLKERIPELQAVRDVTDHSDRTSAYY